MNEKTKMKGRDDGQGLVEYALILVLVSITVIVALNLLGQQVNTVFQQVSNTLNGSSIQTVTATRDGGGTSNDVDVVVTVSGSANVTITDSQSGQVLGPLACTGTCSVRLSVVGNGAGTITVSDGVGEFSTSYDERTT